MAKLQKRILTNSDFIDFFKSGASNGQQPPCPGPCPCPYPLPCCSGAKRYEVISIRPSMQSVQLSWTVRLFSVFPEAYWDLPWPSEALQGHARSERRKETEIDRERQRERQRETEKERHRKRDKEGEVTFSLRKPTLTCLPAATSNPKDLTSGEDSIWSWSITRIPTGVTTGWLGSFSVEYLDEMLVYIGVTQGWSVNRSWWFGWSIGHDGLVSPFSNCICSWHVRC